jgi:hypothetical protein
MSAQPQPRLTPEQYLQAERAADTRSGYYQGPVIPRPPDLCTTAVIAQNSRAA